MPYYLVQVMSNYDSRSDVLTHREIVSFWIDWISRHIKDRAEMHDESKLHPPEKETFDRYTQLLKSLEFGSEDYKNALDKIGDGIKHHYRANPHHPEYHSNGISDMTIIDLIEMLADWMAVTGSKGGPMNIEYLQERFKIDSQLMSILSNTLIAADIDIASKKIPPRFIPSGEKFSGGS